MVMIPRKLTPFDVDKLTQHFIEDIKGNDRRLRFGMASTDEIVEKYLKGSFEQYGYKNIWFVVEDKDIIVASCHVAYCPETNTAEMGCTVSTNYRNQKIGQELFNRGITWARMNGAENVFMHCLSENKTIQHIAQKNGMTVVTIDPSEKESTIKVKQSRLEAGFKDYIMDQIAIYDSAVRKQVFFANKFMKSFVK
jgi:RimJ/RimL family protein N-acetyltransferase